MKKFLGITAVSLLLVLTGWFLFHFYFVFGEGVKAGELNFVVYKGIVFKTYQGRLIQAGLTSRSGANGSPGIQSNEFNFSIEDKVIADSLMRCGGSFVELHYKEFRGALPWRGHSNYVVDGIIRVTPGHSLFLDQ